MRIIFEPLPIATPFQPLSPAQVTKIIPKFGRTVPVVIFLTLDLEPQIKCQARLMVRPVDHSIFVGNNLSFFSSALGIEFLLASHRPVTFTKLRFNTWCMDFAPQCHLSKNFLHSDGELRIQVLDFAVNVCHLFSNYDKLHLQFLPFGLKSRTIMSRATLGIPRTLETSPRFPF